MDIEDRGMSGTSYNLNKPINDLEKDDINQWALNFRNDYKTLQTEKAKHLAHQETISVIKRAIVLDSIKRNAHRQLRDSQLISVLLFLNAPSSIIAQISTGEGKSLIIAVLAIIKVLQGWKVDVITSSTVLAKQGCKDQKSLFDMFKINVDHNSDDDYKFKGTKRCYKN